MSIEELNIKITFATEHLFSVYLLANAEIFSNGVQKLILAYLNSGAHLGHKSWKSVDIYYHFAGRKEYPHKHIKRTRQVLVF